MLQNSRPAAEPAEVVNIDDDDDNQDGSRAGWTDEQICTLLECLIEATHQAQASEGGFKPAVFKSCRVELKQVHGIDYSDKQVRNKVTSLKGRWKLVLEVAAKSGFGWDDELKCVTADEETWDELIKVSDSYNVSILVPDADLA